MTWHALHYPIRNGSEDVVKDLFRTSGRPNFTVRDDDGQQVGQLLGTMAFVGPGKAIRVIEVEGPLPLVARHMGRQAEVRAFEDQLDGHLTVARDMRSPDGAREFFRHAGLRTVIAGVGGNPADTRWRGAYYTIRPGTEQAVNDVLGRHASANQRWSAFVGEGKVFVQSPIGDSHADDTADFATLQRLLSPYLADEHDVEETSEDEVLRTASVECVIARRHDREL